MQEITGYGNWKIKYEEIDGGIRILRALTCDRAAALPDELSGLPVTEIGDYALSIRDKSPDRGEEALIRDNMADPEAKWDNRGIRELRLPASVRRIGSYAFMDCHELMGLDLPDGPIDWGQSPFMNCMSLHDILLRREGEEMANLYFLCSEITAELDVRILRKGKEEIRVLFPGYTEIWEENTPARQFNYAMDGAGFPYHHVFRGRKLDWKDYDGLWDKSFRREGSHTEEALLLLAWYRLRYPEGLRENHAEAYRAYIRGGTAFLLGWIMDHGQPQDLEFFLGLTEPPEEVLKKGMDQARERGETGFLAVMLEKQKGKRPAGRRKRFEL